MNIKTIVKFNLKKIMIASEKGAQKGLTRAATSIWKTARKKIRNRKNKTSKAGNPPIDHGTFRRSLAFSVEKTPATAFIGAKLLPQSDKLLSKPVPAILEFGGIVTYSQQKTWFRKLKKSETKMSTTSSVTDYFVKKGYGPLFMGLSKSSVASQAGANKSSGWVNHIRTRKNMISGQKIFYLSVPLKSRRMAIRAAKNAVKYFNYPTVKSIKVKARPYMGPSLEESKSMLAQYFSNTIK